MQAELEQIETEALTELKVVNDLRELESLRIKYFGRKGQLTTVMRGMRKLSKEERPIVGKLANEVRTNITAAFDRVTETLNQRAREQQLAAEAVDITLPGRRPRIGKKHPITQTFDRIQEIFRGMGFQVAEGPEIEHEYYNFDALNTPAEHPARDLHDTFYIANELVLRTHTSPVQVRVMEKQKPPVRIIVPGKVYRLDYDISHTPMFHQVEGLLVDHQVTFSELKGVLYSFARQMFGEMTRVRFRPGFFPFTEPSAEIDISCTVCGGKGCRTCSRTGWLEILGAGSVHPNVFRYVNYDPEQITGFAFGMGVDRIAMLRFGITDLRLIFENDMRFAQQF
ncbi:MAG: phenylalanine--tRNA ligase subunit alpha [Candidatus Poribacteria bacterium]|nr:phenylalanine--tRNA ligase subunit alpha [Candidatus Poribacteria bacterium]